MSTAFEPTWLQVVKTGSPTIDRALHGVARSHARDHDQPVREALRFRCAFHKSTSIMIAKKSFEDLERRETPFCKAEVAFEAKEGRCYILDTVSEDNVQVKHARDLASPF